MIGAVVIGGGQAGLGVSVHLTRLGIEHTVLERGLVGETWRSQRWESFALNTPNWMNGLPGDENVIEPRDAFLARDGWVARLEAYASRHRVPLRTGTTVTAVTARPGESGFVVTTTTNGGTDEIETDSVVVASGILRIPRIPALAGSVPDGILQVHAGGYRRPADLPTGAVLVVGGAQSGVQIVEDLLDAGRTVYLCTSAVSRLRRRYRARDSFEWLVEGGFFDIRLETLTDPQVRFATQPLISGVGRLGHTVSLQSLADRGVRLLGRPAAVAHGRLQLDDTVGANIAFGDRKSAETAALIDDHLRTAGVRLPPLEADPADDPHPDPGSIHSPPELDLEAAGIGSVVWATGFTGDFDYLHVPVLDDHGMPVHERGVARVPGVYFVGFPWLSNRKSGIIHGVDYDAAITAARVAERRSPG